MTISERIFLLLKEKNMTQKRFSELTGISEAAISDWKKRGTNPSSEKILKICEVLNVTPNELLMWADSKNKSIKPLDYTVYVGENEEKVLVEIYPKVELNENNHFVVAMEDRVQSYFRQFGKHIEHKNSQNTGSSLNHGAASFVELFNGLYVDKTAMLTLLNELIETNNKYICVSRPRRFGKTIAGYMMCAYYGYREDTKNYFDRLIISRDATYLSHLNKYDVVLLDAQGAQGTGRQPDAGIKRMEQLLFKEMHSQYPSIVAENEMDKGTKLIEAIYSIFKYTGRRFVLIIDEWDSIFRNESENKEAQNYYINWLKGMFKDNRYQEAFALVYMTGIMPIKRYGTQSALNNFKEVTFVNPGKFGQYTGFTEAEVKTLCQEYGVDFSRMKRWYDGYVFADGVHIFNPKSVIVAIQDGEFDSYWSKTGTFETIRGYIIMNHDGLRDDIKTLLGGEKVRVDLSKFQNDMNTISSKDDVFAALCHLGYLAYQRDPDSEIPSDGFCWIPNMEIQYEFKNAIEAANWSEVTKAIESSRELLQTTWDMDCEKVAAIIDQVHTDNTSILKYNDENSLSCVISIAYFYARNKYTVVREMPAGKGYADLVFVPFGSDNLPAMIVELKYDKSASTALNQIREKRYMDSLKGYSGTVLLVGINYDKETKQHQCKIEKMYID